MNGPISSNARKLAIAKRELAQGPFTSGECSVHSEEVGERDGAAVFAADGQPWAMFSSDCFIGGKEGALGAAEFLADLLNAGRKEL